MLVETYFAWLSAAAAMALLLALYEFRGASKSATETVFALEKELALARVKRARTALVAAVAFAALLALWKLQILPAQPILQPQTATPTRMMFEPPTAVPATPTATITRSPTRRPPTAAPPTATASPTVVPPPSCPLPGVCITQPRANQTLDGVMSIRGTANIDNFQFFKVEYGMGENPQSWHSIGDVRRTPAIGTELAQWDTTGFPNGVYHLRLTVVDRSGNFPQPFDIRVVLRGS